MCDCGKTKKLAAAENAPLGIAGVYTGERRNLTVLLGCRDWAATFFALQNLAKEGTADAIKAGDYFNLPIKAESGRHGGIGFKALDIAETELVVTQARKDRIILNFEDALFFSAVNAKDANNGGFKGSALSKYLNAEFLDALSPVKEVLLSNVDGGKVSLPTLYEVAGDDEFGTSANWEEEPHQLEYFKRIKNRIRTSGNNTRWWWLSTAAHATDFAYVNYYGSAHYYNASAASGGVAPAICVI
jgi:hypothetical protein